MRRRGAFLFPLLVLFAGASLIREAAVGGLLPAEEAWEAQLARRLTYTGGPPPVTLVEINDETLAKHVWPWTAEEFAKFFNDVLPSKFGGKPYEPSVIGIEPILDFEKGALAGGERDAINERALHDGVLRTAKLALGGRLGWARELDSVQPLMPVAVLNHIRGDTGKLPAFTSVEAWADEALRLSTQPGWTNMPGGLGQRGRCSLIVKYRGQPVPTMPLQLAMMWAKVTPDEVEVTLGDSISLGSIIRIPIDEEGRMQVNLGVQPYRVSYDDLLVTRYQIDNGNPPLHAPEKFDKKVILLARTDAASRTIDLPVGGKISPGELSALALATIQTKAYPQRIGLWFDWTVVGVAALVSFWLPRWKSRWMALGVLLGEVLYIGAAWWLFGMQHLALPGILPLGLMLWLLLLRVFAKPMQRVIAF